MKKQKSIRLNYDPTFATFPLASTEYKETESGVTLPSEDGVEEVKAWVDFKEM